MLQDDKILVGKGENPVYLLPRMANRHGLIAGATGTGKTVTLKVLAEGLSDLGVPVFLADIKGDVGGTALPGTLNDKITERLQTVGVDHPGARHRHRRRADAARPPARSDRCTGRRAQHRFPRR